MLWNGSPLRSHVEIPSTLPIVSYTIDFYRIVFQFIFIFCFSVFFLHVLDLAMFGLICLKLYRRIKNINEIM